MKTFNKAIFVLLLTFVCSSVQGQTSFDGLIYKYAESEHPDSAFIIMDIFEEKYRSGEQWDSLLYLTHQRANLSFRFKSIDIVLKQIDEGERIAEEYVNETNIIYLNFLEFISDVKQDTGNYQEAGEILDKIIRIGSEMKGDTTGIVDSAKAEKAFLYLYLGKVKESEALASSIYESIIARGDTQQIMSMLQSLALSNHWLNKYDEAIKYNIENLNIIKQFNGETHPNVGLMLSQIAGVYTDKGQLKEAIESFNKSKEIHLKHYRKSGNSRLLSSAIGNMGDFYSTMGEYRLAIDHMTYSLEMEKAEYGENSWTCMWHYSVLSTACRLYGDYDQADKYIEEAFKLIEANDQSTPYDYYHFLSRKAEMLYTRDQYEDAALLAMEVYDFFEKNQSMGSMNDRLHILNLITDIYTAKKDYELASEWSKRNFNYHRENTDPMSDLMLGVWVANLSLYSDLKDSNRVNELVTEILVTRNIGNKVYTLSKCVPANNLLDFSAEYAEYLIGMSEVEPAFKKEYFDFLEEFEKYYNIHLSTIKTNSNLASNEQFIKRIYSPAIHIKTATDPEQALLLIEKCKGFQIRQVLQNQLIEDDNLPTLNYNLENSPGLNDDSISVEIFMTLSSSLDSVAAYKDSLLQHDQLKYQKYFGVKELTLNDVRELIDEDEILIEFFVQDSILFAFYIDDEQVMGAEMPYDKIENLTLNVLNSSDSDVNKSLRSLLLPDSIISNYNSIKILPDGILNSLSFEHLEYEGKPLIYSKLVSYGLSASILLYQKKLTSRKKVGNQFLGLTPGFTRDLKLEVDSLYTNSDSSFFYLLQQPFLLSLSESLSRDFNGETYMKKDATEQKFKAKARDFRILHIGTHGILNDDSPLFSKLIFARDSLEDGYLHAYELYGNNLNADLAVLSACSSGKEKTYASEGIVSLSHAFTYAGCPAVLMTKWDVDEKSTSFILQEFYKNLKTGMTKSTALREAKLTFLKQAPAELQDPYYWAGLVLIGDDSPMFSSSWFSGWKGLLLLVFLVLLIGYFSWKKNRLRTK